MSRPTLETPAPPSLRQRAHSRLNAGTRRENGLDNASAALSVLHDLASSPTTAADALALLHELQVHQVEVDLQAEELRNSRAELESALSHQVALYDLAPVGLLTVDRRSVLCELNQTGAQWLGQDRERLPGQALTSFLSPGSADTLRSLLDRADGGDGGTACRLQLGAVDVPPRAVHATASFNPATDRFLLALMDCQSMNGAAERSD